MKRIKKSILILNGSILTVLILIILFWIAKSKSQPENQSTMKESHIQEKEPAVNAKEFLNKVRLIHREQWSENQQEIVDATDFYDPTNQNPVYLEKYHRHQEIGQFVYSTRRNDPKYRRIMTTLLENGFDVKHWGPVAKTVAITDYHVSQQRKLCEQAGMSEQEINEHLAIHLELQKDTISSATMAIAVLLRLTDEDMHWWRELMAIEYEMEPEEKVVGEKHLILLRGDKFLTDDDWLDDEFRAAKNRYHGRPREEIMTEVERKQQEESRKFMQERRRAFLERQQEQTENE